MNKWSLFYILHAIVTVLYKGVGVAVLKKSNTRESNFFITKFYNNKLSKAFHKNDYHFFRLVFIKLLIKSKFLKKNMNLDNVVRTLENIEFGINQKSDEVFMALYDEIRNISLDQYKEIYAKNEIDKEIEKDIEEETKKSEKNSKHKKNVLAVVPFSDEQVYNSSDSSNKAQILLDILYVSIVASYQQLNEAEKRNILRSLYENTINQWMSLNFLQKIMKYKLSFNKDSILLYISLERKTNTHFVKEEDISNIQNKLKHTLEEFILTLYPNNLGYQNYAFVVDKLTNLCMPKLRVIGYRTTKENKLWNLKNVSELENLERRDPGKTLSNNGNKKDENDPSWSSDDIPENFFHGDRNRNKIIVQILISNSQEGKNSIKDDSYDIQLSIENIYNILIDNFLYNENFTLSYEKPVFVMAKYIFGYDKNIQQKDEEKKYEDISLHIFLKIKGKVKFTFKHVQNFLFKYTKYFNSLYSIHFYGACIKLKNTDIIKVAGQFGEGIDNNLINNVILKMKPEETVAHIKLYSKKRQANNLDYVSTKEIKEELNKSTYFNVIYYLVDTMKEKPKPINCATCRHFKYHYIILLIAAIFPSLIIFSIFFLITYCRIRKYKNSKNTCSRRLSQIYPSLFYVKTASNGYRRLNKTNGKVILLKGTQPKSVLKNGFKNNTNGRRVRLTPHKVTIYS
ncbi:hypothetical protein, conserved [Plasmodium gonderi]|uniref:Uncharacterized protein n=1 Tax=Plasmodium gonderi TaxID=77519 RepID=A0A1Y1JEZ8_PLAGO|nr:hypothetical protein, conserved [Plasmodium gonderi]GAW81086.1 hypothetical protein, conserved [Plasmodium gonderi]